MQQQQKSAVTVLLDMTLLTSEIKFLTFRGPCIVIYYYNKTNEMH